MLGVVEVVVVNIFQVYGILRFQCYIDYDRSCLYDFLMLCIFGKDSENCFRVDVEEY